MKRFRAKFGAAIFIAFLGGACSLLQLPTAMAAESGEAIFQAKCAICHAKDGSGNTAMGKSFKVRDLRSKEVQKLSDKETHDIVANGKSPMPAYGNQLNEKEVDSLVAYIRDLAKEKR